MFISQDVTTTTKAIEYHKQALTISRETGDKRGEGADLGNLGSSYSALGDVTKAIEYHRQALVIRREIGNKLGEAINLENLANALIEQGDFISAFDHLHLSLQIAKSIQSPRQQSYTGVSIARAQLLQGDLVVSRQAIETARQHDAPDNNHTAAVLHGVITLRLADMATAQAAFSEAVAFASTLLNQPQAIYTARYAQALSRAGLAIIANSSLDEAKVDYEAALAQCDAKGIVRQQLRLLEELAKTPNGERLEPLLALLRERV